MLLLVLVICILFSGCVAEKNITQTNESIARESVNTTAEDLSSTNLSSTTLSSTALSSKAENLPEIEVRSLSSIYTLSNLEKTDGYYFNWDNVPGYESQSLMLYLKSCSNIVWLADAQIVKTNNNETIRVFTSKNSLDFTLKNNKAKILVTVDSNPWYNWEIRNESGKIRVYAPENHYKSVYNITERHYLVYNLSIRNNGSKNFDFKINELNIHEGSTIGGIIYNAKFDTIDEPGDPFSYRKEVLLDLEKETKIENTTLYPGQNISGSVIYLVNSSNNSSHYESFLLFYDETPITSASFEKSSAALNTAEQCNYSVIFDKPTYYDMVTDSFEPDPETYPSIWSNYVNRSIVEFFKIIDSDVILKYPPTDISTTDIVYVLKVIPDRNITTRFEKNIISGTESYPENHFIAVDDTAEELINASLIQRITILNNQTYEIHSKENLDIPQLNFSNATILRISYENTHGSQKFDRLSIINQDLILDDKMNIVEAAYHCCNAG